VRKNHEIVRFFDAKNKVKLEIVALNLNSWMFVEVSGSFRKFDDSNVLQNSSATTQRFTFRSPSDTFFYKRLLLMSSHRQPSSKPPNFLQVSVERPPRFPSLIKWIFCNRKNCQSRFPPLHKFQFQIGINYTPQLNHSLKVVVCQLASNSGVQLPAENHKMPPQFQKASCYCTKT
jgi:hypothetical protein